MNGEGDSCGVGFVPGVVCPFLWYGTGIVFDKDSGGGSVAAQHVIVQIENHLAGRLCTLRESFVVRLSLS